MRGGYPKVTLLWIKFRFLERKSLHEFCPSWSVDKVLNRWTFVDTFRFGLRLSPLAGRLESIFPHCNFLHLLYVTAKHLLIIHRQGLVVVSQNWGHLNFRHLEFRLFLIFVLL